MPRLASIRADGSQKGVQVVAYILVDETYLRARLLYPYQRVHA